MIEFIPLASSSAGCSYLVKADGHAPLLIDAGLPFGDLQKMLWSEGVNVSDLAGCLISHGHGDHAKAVPKLMAAGVTCYALQHMWEFQITPSHRAMSIGDGDAIVLSERFIGGECELLHVLAFEAVHDEPTLGFMVSVGSQHLLYLTDSAYCPYRFEGLTHICVEANYSEELLKENAMTGRVAVDVARRTLQTHASIERVIEMLKANDLSNVVEIHLLHLSDSNSDAEEFRLRIQKRFGIATYVARRGARE